MGKLTIIGNANPVIGKLEMYSISTVNNWLQPSPLQSPLQMAKVQWGIFVQDRNGWRRAKNDKEGQIVPYTFGQKSLSHKAIKIVVQRGNDMGELLIHPQRAKEPKITKVELLDVNYNPIPKGKKLSYKDTIVARAHCIEMFKKSVSFTLWEDDAQGEGHDPVINALNKINPIPLIGSVNQYGKADVVFRLPMYTMAVQIANARIATGDKNEGATHEYYVTAEVVDKKIMNASPNVNVVNPTYNPTPPPAQPKPKSTPQQLPQQKTPPPTKPEPVPAKPKPNPDSAKFPQTPAAKKQADPEGKIISAEFTDGTGKTLKNAKTGDVVSIKIVTQNMKGKTVNIKIWEEDLSRYTNDLLYEKPAKLLYDTNFLNNVKLTKEMYDKSYETGEGSEREYFIEVIHNGVSVDSPVIPVTLDAQQTKPEPTRTKTNIDKPKEPVGKNKCPNCEKPITLQQLIQIMDIMDPEDSKKKDKLTLSSKHYKIAQTHLDGLNQLLHIYDLDHCIQKAHLLAQICEETGFHSVEEGFNYTQANAKTTFNAYFSKHPGNVKKYAREEVSSPAMPIATRIEMANKVYGPEVEKDLHLGNKYDTDGYSFRGRGLIQITGREVYTKFNEFYEQNYRPKAKSAGALNFVTNPDLVVSPPWSALSAIYYWIARGIKPLAAENKESVQTVTKRVNKALKHLKRRQAFFESAVKVLEVNKCKPIEPQKAPNNKSIATYDKAYSTDDKTAYIDIIQPFNRLTVGLLVVFDNTGVLFKCYAFAHGTGGTNRLGGGKYGDIPTGRWAISYSKRHVGELAFGNHGVFDMTGIDGEAKKAMDNGRDGILIHCGHTYGWRKKVNGKKEADAINDKGSLMVTHGCVRVYNDDMPQLIEVYNNLKKSGKKIIAYVEDVTEDEMENKVYKAYGTVRDPKDYKRKTSKPDDSQ